MGTTWWSQCLMSNWSSWGTQNWESSAINSWRSSTGDHTSWPPQLSLFISDSLTVIWLWKYFLSPDYRIKFQRKYPYFYRYPNFPKTQCSMGRGKPAGKKSAWFVEPFRYNTGVTYAYMTTANTVRRYARVKLAVIIIIVKCHTSASALRSVGCWAVGWKIFTSWSRPLVASTGMLGWGSNTFIYIHLSMSGMGRDNWDSSMC